MSFWSCNIDRRGRLARLLSGIVILVAGIGCLISDFTITGIALIVGGAFCIFQGARGWCLMHAIHHAATKRS